MGWLEAACFFGSVPGAQLVLEDSFESQLAVHCNESWLKVKRLFVSGGCQAGWGNEETQGQMLFEQLNATHLST